MAKFFGMAIVATALLLGSVGIFFGLPASQGSSVGLTIWQPQENAGIIVIMQPQQKVGSYPTFRPSVEKLGLTIWNPTQRAGLIMR